jgi:ribokinase
MDILNFGSINIDHVYQVDHIIRPGETLPSSSYHIHAGGKGANQSVAIVRAGGSVKHAGTIGENGRWLKELLESSGVDTSLLRVTDQVATGHTIIQVDKSGQNSIILFGGGNNMQDESYIRAVFDSLTGKEVLLIQNEISSLPLILELALERRLRICMNPAPFTEGLLSLPLNRVEMLICNEVEAQGLTSSTEESPKVLIEHLSSLYPEVQIILTAGADGVYWNEGSTTYHEPAHPAQVVDTTAAGDTFIGYFLTFLGKDSTVEEAIRIASDAAALAVSREGAMDSIPFSKELKVI